MIYLELYNWSGTGITDRPHHYARVFGWLQKAFFELFGDGTSGVQYFYM